MKGMRKKYIAIIALKMFLALHRGYIELNDGWFSPFNGYQYKVARRASWQNSRNSCQSMGADLVVYGVQDTNTRRFVY